MISDVPADSLNRTERPPTKEIIRYFIRHYALRLGMGESAPWVVEDELVKKFNLPSKFSDFLLDPHKVIYSWQFLFAYYKIKKMFTSSWLTLLFIFFYFFFILFFYISFKNMKLKVLVFFFFTITFHLVSLMFPLSFWKNRRATWLNSVPVSVVKECQGVGVYESLLLVSFPFLMLKPTPFYRPSLWFQSWICDWSSLQPLLLP